MVVQVPVADNAQFTTGSEHMVGLFEHAACNMIANGFSLMKGRVTQYQVGTVGRKIGQAVIGDETRPLSSGKVVSLPAFPCGLDGHDRIRPQRSPCCPGMLAGCRHARESRCHSPDPR